jgi:hypothetical protein
MPRTPCIRWPAGRESRHPRRRGARRDAAEAAGRQRDPGAHPLLRRYERARANVGMQLVTGGFRYQFGNGPAQPLRVAACA